MTDSPRPLLALRLAARSLRRDPATTGLAVGILALGLALPAVFFSFLVGAGRALPVPDGDRVVRVDVLQPERDGRIVPVGPRELEALQGTSGLEELGGFRVFPATVTDPGATATRVSVAAVTPRVLPLLGVAPVVGRLPRPGEEDVLLLGRRTWEDAWNADPGLVGRVLTLNGTPRTVVGIMPEGFGFPFHESAWIPVAMDAEASLELVGRLADGVSPAGATAELAARWARGDPQRVAERTGGRVRVDGFTDHRGEGGEVVAFVGLVLIALCLLLIACANVANLLLVRATRRVRALGIQSALGAGRAQIGLQLLGESLLVAFLGGTLGLILAWGGVEVLERTLAEQHFGYFWMRLTVDGTVVAFVGALVVGTALVSGVLPVVRVLGVDVQRLLREEGVGVAVGGGGAWSRGFVTGQLALSCGALVAAGLTGGALVAASDFGSELPGDRILLASLDPEAGPEGHQDLLASLSALPGVAGAALARGVLGFGEGFGRLEVEGVAYARPDDRQVVVWNAVSPGYFDLFGTRLLDGRLLTGADAASDRAVAVVGESFARRFAPDGPILGRRIRVSVAGEAEPRWHTVVGVVGDVEVGGGERMLRDRVYLPLVPGRGGSLMAVIRTRGPASEAAGALRSAVAEARPGTAVWGVRTLADAHAYLVRLPRTLSILAVVGGLAGLLVAAVGLYGLLSFRVRQRRRELGVRLALGADGRTLALDVLGAALRQVLPALALGLLLAWLVAPVLSVLLLGGDARAPGTYAGVAVAFVAVGILAALPPARRAWAVDPARVLRGD